MASKSLLDKIETLKKSDACNLILIGEESGKIRDYAVEIASEWLNTSTEELPYHPDFKELWADNGSLRVEHAEIIQTSAGYVPLSGRAVCIVNEAETMTGELQNRLLKVLEDNAGTLAVIFVTKKALLDTVSSRCVTIEVPKMTRSEMSAMTQYRCTSVMLASDGNEELYKTIEADEWFYQYLEGFYDSFIKIKQRTDLKNILRLTHAIKVKDKEYLPEKLEGWQMKAFICMLKLLFWYVLLETKGVRPPAYVRTGNLGTLYSETEAEQIYHAADDAYNNCMKKGSFTKNDFFELLMYMIPLD